MGEILNNMWIQLRNMQWSDYLDILVVAFLIYKVLPLFRSAGTLRILKGIVAVLLIAWLTEILDMYAMHYMVEQVMTVGLLALVILFAPELRRILDHLGNVKIGKFFGNEYSDQDMRAAIDQTVMACEQLSKEKVGALIVFARDNALEEYRKTGTEVDAQISDPLLRNIFFHNSPLHDGAVIVADGRIACAGCVLPLSANPRIPKELGTRHHAAVGMSEASDAVIVVVSEETGTISVAVGGMLKRHLAPQMLGRLLHNELMPDLSEKEENLALRLKQKLRKTVKGDGRDEK
ncbi:MAG: TIGR00159 family protein [Ruminococcaceae bacterium]|nr:TIGR00159 family protein [Oscillospiraceae bacterium]